MASFKYSAKDSLGRTVTGVIDGDDVSMASKSLHGNGLFPLELKELQAASLSAGSVAPKIGIWEGFVNYTFHRVPTAALCDYYIQLQSLVKTGVSLARAMDLLAGETPNARLRQIAFRTAPILSGGGKLADAWEAYPWIFPYQHIAFLRAGEFSGRMVEAIQQIINSLEMEKTIQQEKLVIVVAILVPKIYILLLHGLVPYLRATIGTVWIYFAIYVVLLLLYRFLNQIPASKRVLDRVKLFTLPGVGLCIRKLGMAKYFRALEAMFASGVPLLQGLELSSGVVGNDYLERKLRTAAPLVDSNVSVADALKSTGLISNSEYQLLRTADQAGQMEDMVGKLAERKEGEAERAVTKTVSTYAGVLYGLVVIYVAYILITFYAGYFGGMLDSADI